MGFDFNSLLAFIVFGVTIGVVYGIVALGISLIYSGLDIVHFAHGEMYMFGAFFGLFIGILMVILIEYFDTTIKSIDDIYSNLNILGIIIPINHML